MNIAIIGYGKMGKAIEEVILEEGRHTIVLKISENNISDFTVENLKKADVAIDFTQPDAAYDNVMKCFEANLPIVVGTTSWADGLSKAKQYCQENNQALFTLPNFSIGVNLFFQLNKHLAKLMARFNDYNPSMVEIHHTEKKDAPSGTAIQLAKDIIEDKTNPFEKWNLSAELNSPNSIPIEAIRQENVPGTHSIRYESTIDFIEITHEAKNRKGFAVGAVRAAEFLYDKKGFYTMADMLSL